MTSLLSFFTGWRLKLALIAITVSSLYVWHRYEVKLAVKEVKQEYLLESSLQYQEITRDAFWASQVLKDEFKTIEKDKDAKLQNLSNRVNTLTASLRNRPARSESRSSNTGSTSDTESRQVSTGLQLYRDDAIFLIWFAERTEQLQIELQTCYSSYDEVKKNLDDFRLRNTPRN
jgi:hypothetical protein